MKLSALALCTSAFVGTSLADYGDTYYGDYDVRRRGPRSKSEPPSQSPAVTRPQAGFEPPFPIVRNYPPVQVPAGKLEIASGPRAPLTCVEGATDFSSAWKQCSARLEQQGLAAGAGDQIVWTVTKRPQSKTVLSKNAILIPDLFASGLPKDSKQFTELQVKDFDRGLQTLSENPQARQSCLYRNNFKLYSTRKAAANNGIPSKEDRERLRNLEDPSRTKTDKSVMIPMNHDSLLIRLHGCRPDDLFHSPRITTVFSRPALQWEMPKGTVLPPRSGGTGTAAADDEKPTGFFINLMSTYRSFRYPAVEPWSINEQLPLPQGISCNGGVLLPNALPALPTINSQSGQKAERTVISLHGIVKDLACVGANIYATNDNECGLTNHMAPLLGGPSGTADPQLTLIRTRGRDGPVYLPESSTSLFVRGCPPLMKSGLGKTITVQYKESAQQQNKLLLA